MAKERFSNFELLRIFAMFIIVMNHFNTHGIFKFWHLNDTLCFKINNLISATAGIGGKLGVMLFVLISGYFLIDSSFKISRAVRVYLKTLIYSVLILIGAVILGTDITPALIKSSLLPIGFRGYWFIKVYIILLLFSPFINIFFNALSGKQLKYFLIFTTTIWFLPKMWGADYCFSELASFIYLYILGAGIKRYDLFNNKKLIYIFGSLSFLIVILHSVFVLKGNNIVLSDVNKYVGLSSILTLLIAVCVFIYFKNLNIKQNKVINSISTAVFGIYLLHDNKIIRPYLWTNVFNVVQYMSSPYFILYLIGISVLIFSVCVVIDKLFDLILKKPMDFISEKADAIFNKIVIKES